MTVILLVLLAKPATKPQASVPARTVSPASPATVAHLASSRAALQWHLALVSVPALLRPPLPRPPQVPATVTCPLSSAGPQSLRCRLFPHSNAETPIPGPTEESSPVEPQGEWTQDSVPDSHVSGERGSGFPEGRRGWGKSGSMPASSDPPPDCDLHCKPARGSYRINLKKFCRKDYGRPTSGLVP